MKDVLDFILNINHIYLMLVALGFVTSFVFLKVNNKKKMISLTLLFYILVTLLTFNYFDFLFNSVFSFSYSSIRGYLVLLIMINIITLVTVNFGMNIVNKIMNYTVFVISSLIFLINIFILVNSNLEFLNINVECITFFINLDFIIFIVYLFLSLIAYLLKEIILKIVNLLEILKYKKEKKVTDVEKNESDFLEESTFMCEPELTGKHLDYVDSEKFIIDGKDCSFIFNDPNKDNVIKNYYILLTNVNARLVNGYTVDENIKIHNILNRLNIKNINNLDLMNMEILSKITIDEYHLLKSYLDNCKSL